MQRNLFMTKPLTSSFLSCEKDTEVILKKLFIECQPYSNILKKLLVVQSSDCLDKEYDVSKYDLKKLIEEKYINLSPKIILPEHSQVKSMISLSFDEFVPSDNPEFRNCMIHFDVLCHHDYWDLGNYRQRPFKILGYIDGLLNKTKLSGIGELNFIGCTQGISNEDWSCYVLTYLATHGSDDQIALNEE